MAAINHGHNRRGRRSPTYNSWRAMIERCHYHRHPFFEHYGGRGIWVCDRWRGPGGFARFLSDLGPRPDGMTLDRIDPDGQYEPENCRWATPIMQRWNRRTMVFATERQEPTEPSNRPQPEVAVMPF